MAHLQRISAQLPHGDLTAFRSSSDLNVGGLIEFLKRSNCTHGARPNCFVNYINEHASSLGNHRVIIYPQSYFVGKSTQVVCFHDPDVSPGDGTGAVSALIAKLSGATGCIVNSTSMTHTRPEYKSSRQALSKFQCEHYRGIFAEDFELWETKCRFTRS